MGVDEFVDLPNSSRFEKEKGEEKKKKKSGGGWGGGVELKADRSGVADCKTI